VRASAAGDAEPAVMESGGPHVPVEPLRDVRHVPATALPAPTQNRR
jgi:hypothetical protein